MDCVLLERWVLNACADRARGHAMANFPSCPSSLRQPLNRCSLAYDRSLVFFRPRRFFYSEHAVRDLHQRCNLRIRRLHGFHVAQARLRRLIVRPFARPSSFESEARRISTAKIGDALRPETLCASGSRSSGVTGIESIQVVNFAQKFDPALGGGTWKAHRGEGVESVVENTNVRDCPANQGNSNESDVALTEDDVCILAQYMTRHNFVRVLEVSRSADTVLAGARVLLLDKPGNVHSIYQKYKLLTESYYDILAALPAVIPEGPIGILGLGAGTAARLIHHFWPDIDMHGWELDSGVVQVARKFFDLEELEWKDGRVANEEDPVPPPMRRRNSSGSYGAWKDETEEIRLDLFRGSETLPRERHGKLRVHVGDALHPEVIVEGGFAGLIVDLFADGAVISPLQQVETWREMREKLRPGGRIIVNCGGSCVEAAGVNKKDGGITMRETIAALAEAFPGELSITNLRDHGDNSVALTGPIPDFQVWKDTLPDCLRPGIEDWQAFSAS